MKFIVGQYEYPAERADMTISDSSISFTIFINDLTVDPVDMAAKIMPIIDQGFTIQIGDIDRFYAGFTIDTIRQNLEEKYSNIIIDMTKGEINSTEER